MNSGVREAHQLGSLRVRGSDLCLCVADVGLGSLDLRRSVRSTLLCCDGLVFELLEALLLLLGALLGLGLRLLGLLLARLELQNRSVSEG